MAGVKKSRLPANKRWTPLRILREMHRVNDGFVAFGKSLDSGQLQHLFSHRSGTTNRRIAFVLENDGRFTPNLYWRHDDSKAKKRDWGPVARKQKDLKYLCACWVDIDFDQQIGDEFHCHELAKDVTALANAGGGLLIIGLKTRLDDQYSTEVVDEIRPISRNLANTQRYSDTITARTYPPLVATVVEWMPFTQAPDKGLVVIRVPDAGDNRPVLVLKVTDESGKSVAAVVGYYERRRATAGHYTVQQLHAIMKDGARFNTLQARLDSLTDATHRLADQVRVPAGRPKPPSPEVIRSRIEALLRDVQLDGKPSIAFAAVPTTLTTVPSLTVSTGGTSELLRDPPILRNGGFGLGYYDSAPLMNSGQTRRAMNEGFKGLELWHDGAFLFVARGDQEFLGWHTTPKENEPFVINTLVVAEATYLFCETYRRLLAMMSPPPEEVRYVLEIRRLDAPGKPPTIRPEKVNRHHDYMMSRVSAPYGGQTFVFFGPAAQPPEQTAFQYLRDFYLWFGIEEDLIPYTGDVAGSRCVKVDELG